MQANILELMLSNSSTKIIIDWQTNVLKATYFEEVLSSIIIKKIEIHLVQVHDNKSLIFFNDNSLKKTCNWWLLAAFFLIQIEFDYLVVVLRSVA